MHVMKAAKVLTAYIREDTPAFLSGPVGIGKSAVVRQTKDALGLRGFIDFRASTRDPVALMGLPDLNGDTTRWLPPDELPQVERDGEDGVLFLDELNTAPPAMQAAMFGLVLDRKVGEYTLPPKWRVVAAGNRQKDKAAAQRMPSALANRFAHIAVEPDYSSDHTNVHTQYFDQQGVDPKLIAFLRFRPELIHKMPEVGDQMAFPTPRSWERAAKFMAEAPMDRYDLISGIVGDDAATELNAFLDLYTSLPSVDQVVNDPRGTKVPDKVSARYAITSALARKVTKDTLPACITYTERMNRDFNIAFVFEAASRDASLSSSQAFIAWATKNHDVMTRNVGK